MTIMTINKLELIISWANCKIQMSNSNNMKRIFNLDKLIKINKYALQINSQQI